MTIANLDLMAQTATYWPPASIDGFGAPSFGAPVEIACRWQERGELFVDREGRETRSRSIVYPDRYLERGGWLLKGTSAETDPRNVAGAFEVLDIREAPEMSGDLVEVKAWL